MLGAAQLGLDARQQFAHREGLGQVIVRAHLQPDHAVDLVVAGGQHQDGNVHLLAQDLADLETVQFRAA